MRHAVIGRSLGIGLAIWAAATLLFRLVGQCILPPEQSWLVLLLYIAIVPLMIVLTLLIYRWLRVIPEQRALCSTVLVLPGMLLEGIVVPLFPLVLPNMDPAADRLFAGWLLFAFAGPLLAALLPRRHD